MVSLFGRGFESHQLHPIKTKSRSIRAAFLLSVCSNGFGMPGSQYGYNHHRRNETESLQKRFISKQGFFAF